MGEKISEDKKLNEIVLELSDELLPVFDKDNDREIPRLSKREFYVSMPYRVGKKTALLARDFGRTFWDAGFGGNVKKMTPERAKDYVLRYISYQGRSIRQSLVDILEVKPAIYKKPKPALDGKYPLNAFEVKGLIYHITS